MDFDLSSEQQQVLDMVERISRDHIDPAARKAEAERNVPDSIIRLVYEIGLLWPIPEAHGGNGSIDPLTAALGIEALAYGDPAITFNLASRSHYALLLTALGGDSQQARHLTPLAADPTLPVGIALYEGYGRNPGEYRTSIRRQADGRWIVRGKKHAVAYGVAPTPLVVIGRDEEGQLRAAIVEPSDAGIRIEDDSPLLGLAAHRCATLSFDTPIQEDRLLGNAALPGDQLSRLLSQIRLTSASIALGLAARAVSYASSYAAERPAFGKTIAAFQGPAFMLADSDIRIRAAKLDLIAAISNLDNADPVVLERQVSATVNYACTVANQATRDSLQVLGGHGFITDHPVERWYRAAGGISCLDFDPTITPFSASL
ncbi:acyl-CoA dehydrogenase [Aliidongia dinghuensis]|uniref:Acyl-CoA dehydrogenase n=1 Tax=Aliidongia dinghuensis TaxID=1867774 RepID=A0A8J3E787_9PROT|nr:acyl-CoA dehydrogenase family protein [Aliidongia dinghuensis]GGF49412.1 acyl-CoA dehydrogenase [Aliidongia dinghuensis]